MKNSFSRILDWYQSNCDSQWEHKYGFIIKSIDNPGLVVQIDTIGTPLENSSFTEINWESSDNPEFDWFSCRLNEKQQWEAGCSVNNIERVLDIFNEWSKQNG